MSVASQQSSASDHLTHNEAVNEAVNSPAVSDDAISECAPGGLDVSSPSTHSPSDTAATGSHFSNAPAQQPHHVSASNAPAVPPAQPASPAVRKLTYSDFKEGDLLGTGSYSTVRLCTRDGKDYAMKIMEKKLILKEKKEKFAKMERDILNLLAHPNIVGMHWCFQDDHSLFFVLDYCSGGELLHQLRELGSFSLEYGAFVLAEIVSALSHIHGHGVIHRDLKPENILLNSAGRIKVSDFGTACFANDEVLRKTFVGTAQYVSPEMLNNQDTCLASDLWALGCIVYQIFSGKLLFNGDSEYLTFQLITTEPVVLSVPSFFPPVAEKLVRDLVKTIPGERLGVLADGTIDYGVIRSQPLFASIDWDNLHKSAPPTPAPLVPRDTIHPPVSVSLDGSADDAAHLSLNPADEDKIASDTQRFFRFLLPGERVMFHSVFKKKLVWGLFFEKDRALVLTDTPRLLYTDPVSNVFKGCFLCAFHRKKNHG